MSIAASPVTASHLQNLTHTTPSADKLTVPYSCGVVYLVIESMLRRQIVLM